MKKLMQAGKKNVYPVIRWERADREWTKKMEHVASAVPSRAPGLWNRQERLSFILEQHVMVQFSTALIHFCS